MTYYLYSFHTLKLFTLKMIDFTFALKSFLKKASTMITFTDFTREMQKRKQRPL